MNGHRNGVEAQLSNWASGVSIPSKEAERAREHRGDGPAIISADELQRRIFPPIRWIVPNLIPEGLTLLCGKPKLGKSWLAMDTGLAV